MFHTDACTVLKMSLILMTTVTRRFVNTAAKQNAKTKVMLDRMLRVDHAGEYGAVRIYKGQMAILGGTKLGPILEEMCEEEKVHLSTFERLLPENRVRPTALLPIWDIAGFALGAGTALLGKEAAMACTVAVETSIGQHYDSQLRELMADGSDGTIKHKELIEIIRKFRDEELEHLETGIEHDAEQAPFYKAMTQAIQIGCKGAIWLSKRV